MTIYLDMDGVLVDFERGVVEAGFHRNKELMSKPESTWTEDEKYHAEGIRSLFDKPAFFAELKPFVPDTEILWKYCKPYNPVILTARPGRKDLSAEIDIVADKRYWVHKYLDCIEDDKFICCLRSEKQKFAKGNILIDDSKQNCKEWELAGGYAIHHISASSSIEQLEYLIKESEFV